jgi:hypothetical protein
MKVPRSLPLLAAILCVFSTGCSDPNAFDDGVAKGVAEAEVFQLDSEQILITLAELTCGVNSELWDAPSGGAERSISHLQPKGRSLNFSDDVTSNEAGHESPYSQVRGKFPLQLDQVISIKEGEDKDTRIVQAKIGVKIADPCFEAPLYIMGIRKGQYRDDLPATLRYERYGEGWHLTKIVH